MSTTSLEPRVAESFPPAPEAVIETHGLTKRYGDVVALDRLDLRGPGRNGTRAASGRTAPARRPR